MRKVVALLVLLLAVLPLHGQQLVNLGSGPNTGTGDTALTAFGKVNANFNTLGPLFSGGAFSYALFGGTWGVGNLASFNAPIHGDVSFTGANANAGSAFAYYSRVTDSGTTYSGGGALVGLRQNVILNSASVTGGRGSGQFDLNINVATGNGAAQNYTALGSACNMKATDAVTGSSCFGGNFIANLQNAATANNQVGTEVDVNESVGGGGAVINGYRAGFQVVDTSSSNSDAQGALGDFGTNVSYANFNANAAGASHGFKYGLTFGWSRSYFPVSSTGTLIYANNNSVATGTGTFTAGSGIDFHLGTFTAFEQNWGNYTVDGSGNQANPSLVLGSPTGGNEGAGTLNAANIFLNGTALGTFATQNFATPPVIGGTTPNSGSFTALTGTAGATISGAATNINASSNFATNIGTGSTTSNVVVGNALNTTQVGGPLQIGTNGAVSAASWTTNGVGLSGAANVYTDTTVSGTIATEAIYALPASTIAATNAGVTITNLTEFYLPVPIAGTNVTGSNLWSLFAQGGVKAAGNINGSGGLTITGTANINASNNTVTNIGTGTTTSAVNIGNGTGNNAVSIGNGTGKVTVQGPLISAAGTRFSVASGTGACGTTSTLVGGVQAGDLTCTAATAASTVTLTLVATTTAYACWGRDITTPTTVTQTGAKSTTSVTLTLTSVTQNDVIQFGCLGY